MSEKPPRDILVLVLGVVVVMAGASWQVASSSSLLAGASSSSLLVGASGLLGKELLASGVLLVGAIDRVVHAEGLQAGANGGNILAYGLEVVPDIGHRIKWGGGGQMILVPHLGRVWEGFSIH